MRLQWGLLKKEGPVLEIAGAPYLILPLHGHLTPPLTDLHTPTLRNRSWGDQYEALRIRVRSSGFKSSPCHFLAGSL